MTVSTFLKQYIDKIPQMIPTSIGQIGGVGDLATQNTVDLGGDYATGTIAAARFPVLSGDVTTTTASLVTAIGVNKVTYGKIQQASPLTLLGNPGSAAANIQEITLGTGLAFLAGSLVATGQASIVEVFSTSVVMVPNTIYIVNNASQAALALPATFNKADLFLILGKGAGGWKVTQNAGQTIRSVTSTTSGTAGSLASSNQYDNVALRGITANTDLVATARNGNLVVT